MGGGVGWFWFDLRTRTLQRVQFLTGDCKLTKIELTIPYRSVPFLFFWYYDFGKRKIFLYHGRQRFITICLWILIQHSFFFKQTADSDIFYYSEISSLLNVTSLKRVRLIALGTVRYPLIRGFFEILFAASVLPQSALETCC